MGKIERPKSIEEDPNAQERIKSILDSASYRKADEDLDFLNRFHYCALRKLHFLLRAKALVAFPGGYGTLDEMFETLTLVQTRTIKPVPVVLVGEGYWRQAFNVDFLVDEGVIDPEDRELFWFAETAQEIWDGIQHWHRVNGGSSETVSSE